MREMRKLTIAVALFATNALVSNVYANSGDWSSVKPIKGKIEKTADFLPATKLANPQQGITYKYYQFKEELTNVDSIAKLNPISSGIASLIDLTKTTREENYAFIFEGYVKVPSDDNYTFSINSDDGSKLVIDDKVEILNDGYHAEEEVDKEVKLAAGFHKIKIWFWQGGAEYALGVSWKSSSIPKTQLPASVLFYDKK